MGRAGAISAPARRGEAIFFGRRLACARCHAGPLFTDAATARPRAGDAFHDIGLPRSPADRGLAEATGRDRDEGRYRTPSLRNAALTAPYMHDGSVPTLAEAIRAHRRLPAVSDAEAADLEAFIGTLTDQTFVTDPRFALPAPCR
jgi:cytochrome c peroxidase